MNPNERQNELAYLNKTLQEITTHLAVQADQTRGTQTELEEALSDYWGNLSVDFWDEAQFAETVERQRSIANASKRRQLQYKKMALSPYFGRIDFAEDDPSELGYTSGLPEDVSSSLENASDESEDASDGQMPPQAVYIGIATLADSKTGSLLVFDWRSPIAGMFYDFGRGKASYQCPAGRITGTIALKRQYKINGGKLEYCFDSDLTIDDEILQQVLSKSADDRMRTIINSIQREQNQVIRDERHRYLLVQGPAGSGKTSIALHRAAYLLYKDRSSISAQNILIFSPNRIFSDYISGVLPEMGEENILQTTFRDYLTNWESTQGMAVNAPVFEDWNEQLEDLISAEDSDDLRIRGAGIHFKSSSVFKEMLDQFFQSFEENIMADFQDIEFRDAVIFSREEWIKLFSVDLAYIPIVKRLAKIRQLIQVQLRPVVKRLRLEKEIEIAATGEEVNEKTIKALARLSAIQELSEVTTRIEHLTSLNPFQIYRRFFTEPSWVSRFAPADRLPPEWPEIRRQTLEDLDNGRIRYEDSLTLLYCQGCLEGFPLRGGIRHLILDEAQDYTLIQYEILRRIFRKASWTVLGDPAQSIHPYLRGADYQDAALILNGEPEPVQTAEAPSAQIIALSRSYRSTREIHAFCRELLPGQSPAQSVNRSGPPPLVVETASPDETNANILNLVCQLKEEGRQSIAIICKTAEVSDRVYKNLRTKMPITHISQEATTFQSGIVAIPSYLAKGLEFDAVIVYDAGSKTYHRETERHLFYTVCTRALHRLILFYTGEKSPFIAAVNPELYRQDSLAWQGLS